MVDTVWMRLVVLSKDNGIAKEEVEHFMFGPTGVVQFKPDENGNTNLILSSGKVIATVKEDQEVIFNLISKIRGTNVKNSTKKTHGKRATQSK